MRELNICRNLFPFSGFLKAELGSCSLASPPCKAHLGADANDGGGDGGEHCHHHSHMTVLKTPEYEDVEDGEEREGDEVEEDEVHPRDVDLNVVRILAQTFYQPR